MPEDHHFCRQTNLAVQDVVVAVLLDGHLNVGSITRRNLRLRHQERRPDLPLEQRIQPLPLLCLGTVLGNDLHVAGIRSSAVDSLRRCPALAQVLSHESVLQVTETSTLLEVCLGQEHVPQSEFLCPLLQVLDYGWM
jgi:hypothetical protein